MKRVGKGSDFCIDPVAHPPPFRPACIDLAALFRFRPRSRLAFGVSGVMVPRIGLTCRDERPHCVQLNYHFLTSPPCADPLLPASPIQDLPLLSFRNLDPGKYVAVRVRRRQPALKYGGRAWT